MSENDSVIVISKLEEIAKNSNTTHTETWKKASIYKIPARFTDQNPKAYIPYAVSFGPFHHQQPHLKPMEVHKQRALHHFLNRSNKPLKSLFDELNDAVESLMDSYDQLDASWRDDSEGFKRLMILDGCFMLEVLRALQTERSMFHDYEANDPVFGDHGKLYVMSFIKRDMLMLENQLPILVLYKLLQFESGGKLPDDYTVNKLIVEFCFSDTSARHIPAWNCQAIKKPDSKPGLHVLDIYRKSLLECKSLKDVNRNSMNKTIEPKKPRCKCPNTGRSFTDDFSIRSAAQLHAAGISFTKSETNSLIDISFEDGVLKLPKIVVDDATEITFLNLIALEHLHADTGNEVTSYVYFMDNIIDSEEDVDLLHKNGIMTNSIGSDGAAATLFNSMSRDTAVDPKGSLYEVHKRVNVYYKQPWNEWRANLIHMYFRNPWAILSLFAALVLFTLTIIQTVYTVDTYYQTTN